MQLHEKNCRKLYLQSPHADQSPSTQSDGASQTPVLHDLVSFKSPDGA